MITQHQIRDIRRFTRQCSLSMGSLFPLLQLQRPHFSQFCFKESSQEMDLDAPSSKSSREFLLPANSRNDQGQLLSKEKQRIVTDQTPFPVKASVPTSIPEKLCLSPAHLLQNGSVGFNSSSLDLPIATALTASTDITAVKHLIRYRQTHQSHQVLRHSF